MLQEPGKAMQRLWTALGRELRYRRDLAALRQMDDKMLADLGIAREQITAYVRGVDAYAQPRRTVRPVLRVVARRAA